MTTQQIPGAEQGLCIAVDANGGEGGLEAILGGVARCLEQDTRVRILLAGDRTVLERELPQRLPPPLHSRVELLHAEEVIGEGENLNVSLRRKTRSSLHDIVDALCEGRAHACISSGNSAALAGVAQLRLGVFPTVERPAFCCRLPHEGGYSYLLDVGAYVDVPPHRLLQFAHLGTALATSNGCSTPRVALLNIGAEKSKGNRQVSRAARLLQEVRELNYTGFVEGHQLFEGVADVIVCDGFAGNVALKASEGAAAYLVHHLRSWLGEEGLAHTREIDPRSYNGALLLGLRGTVVKSHGRADRVAFFHSMEYAAGQARCPVLTTLAERFTAGQAQNIS